MSGTDKNYLYLNGDPPWSDFQFNGLEIALNGDLQLRSVPLLEGELPEEFARLELQFETADQNRTGHQSEAPAGIAVDREGTVYFSDPENNRIWRTEACSGRTAPAPCIDQGARPGKLYTPRGLLIPRRRHALFVVDSANHRIAIFDLNSFQLLELWGQEQLASGPQPGNAPGQFNDPWTLTDDLQGNVYVVEHGNPRVQKFNLSGDVVPGFWETLRRECLLQYPTDIASDSHPELGTVLYVADRVAHKIFVIDPAGRALRDAYGKPISFGIAGMEPMGLAVDDRAVYIGDNALGRRRVLTFAKSKGQFVFAGEAVGYRGPVRALAIGCNGRLLVHSGAGLAPLRFEVGKGFRKKGIFWSRGITPATAEVQWHRLSTELNATAATAHLQFFLHVGRDASDGPRPPDLNLNGGNPFVDPRWKPLPLDVTDVFIADPGRYLWIGGLFSGDGTASPVISQMRVEFNHQGYVEHLPAIYRRQARCDDFLLRLLSLFESFYSELENKIEQLPALFDPAAIPAEFLPWLANWLAFELDETWDEPLKRRLISEAFAMYAQRGTVEGLRKALRIFAGVEAVIEEPVLTASWWSLPAEETTCQPEQTSAVQREKNWQGVENSLLSVSTMLVSAESQGAVVGTSAVLDRSHLITSEEFAAPLFEEVAHQFSVQVLRGQLRSAGTLPQIRRVLDREKPAHTTYHLCVIEPRMRVGYQARIGIDTVISGEPAEMKLNEGLLLGETTTLGGQPPGRVGQQSQVGLSTRIG
jgi:phage tail-like protein